MLNYEVHGSPDRPTLMLMHGFMSSNAQWDLNIERLSSELQVVLVELLGHGDSPTPEEPELYGHDAVLGYLEDIRKTVGVDTWWVGGHSLGGATTIRYALAHPDRVDGIVFTNTRAAFGTKRESDETQQHVFAAGTNVRELRFHPIGAKHFPPEIKERMVAIADRMQVHVLSNTVGHRTRWSSVADLHKLAMPVRLINGRFERKFQPLVEVALERLPTLDVVHLDGGHAVNIEAPDAYNQAVLDFISSHQ
jgi:pimeloyl-ACP methyl ester carboxylesterase